MDEAELHQGAISPYACICARNNKAETLIDMLNQKAVEGYQLHSVVNIAGEAVFILAHRGFMHGISDSHASKLIDQQARQGKK